MIQLIQFGACFLLGLVLRITYRLITLLEKKTALVPVTVILDIGLSAVAVFAFGAISFFLCDGQFFSYCLAGVILGYGVTALIV